MSEELRKHASLGGGDGFGGLLALLGEFILGQDAIVYAREQSLLKLELAKLHQI